MKNGSEKKNGGNGLTLGLCLGLSADHGGGQEDKAHGEETSGGEQENAGEKEE